MNNKNYKNNGKELQRYKGSLIKNNDEAGNIIDDFDCDYEEPGNVQENKSDRFQYSTNISKNQNKTVSDKDAIAFFKVASVAIIMVFTFYLSYFYIGVNRLKNKGVVKKQHVFIDGTSIDLQCMDNFSFEEHLQTANLEEINIAINKLNKRGEDLKGFYEGAKERIKNKEELKIQLGFLQLQAKEVEKKLKMLEKKKSELESLND